MLIKYFLNNIEQPKEKQKQRIVPTHQRKPPFNHLVFMVPDLFILMIISFTICVYLLIGTNRDTNLLSFLILPPVPRPISPLPPWPPSESHRVSPSEPWSRGFWEREAGSGGGATQDKGVLFSMWAQPPWTPLASVSVPRRVSVLPQSE